MNGDAMSARTTDGIETTMVVRVKRGLRTKYHIIPGSLPYRASVPTLRRYIIHEECFVFIVSI